MDKQKGGTPPTLLPLVRQLQQEEAGKKKELL